MSYINTYQSQVYICPLSLKPPIPSHISRLSQRPDLSSLSHIGNLGALLNSDEKCLTAWLAQLVEHGTLNPRAVGSRPTLSSCSSTFGASLVAQLVKNLLAMRETWVQSLGGKIPWRRERLPTPVFWPAESRGLYRPWVHKETRLSGLHWVTTLMIDWKVFLTIFFHWKMVSRGRKRSFRIIEQTVNWRLLHCTTCANQ